MTAKLPAAGLPVPLAIGLPSTWSTPKKLRVLRGVGWALTVLLFVFAASTLTQSRRAFKTIGKDTVPSIIAAEEIGYGLADLDANVANSLLGTARHRQVAAAAIEKQRLRVTDSLVDAAQNITYGDSEKLPIRMMTRDLGLYLERAAEARFRFEQNDLPGARLSYASATELLHAKLLVEAGDLDSANKVQLDAAYWDGGRETEGAELIIVLLGVLLAGTLVVLQVFLFRKTRRLLNAPLLGATAAAVLLAGGLAYQFTNARDSLRVAKEDAFDSIHALVRARAIAFDANGDESRFLLDPAGGVAFEAAFRNKVAKLTSDPSSPVPTEREIARRKERGQHDAKAGVTGLFWDELSNITFDGEYASATRMMAAFSEYAKIDQKIRALASSGKIAEAVELCIGDRPDESNASFDRFDAALGSTLDVNRAAFDHEIDGTTHALATTEAVAVGGSIAVAFLLWLGLRPRLREFEA